MNRLIKSTALGLSVLMGCSLCACGVTDSSLGQKTEINPGLWVEKEVALEPDPSDILALTTTTDGQLLCATVQSNGEASQKVDVLSSSDGYTWDTTPVYSVEVPGTCIEASLTESGVLVLIRTEDEEQIWYGAKETECSQVQPADSEVTDINNIQFVNSDSFLMAGRDTNNQSVAAIFSLRDGRMVTKVGAGTEWGGFAQHGDELAFISETGKLSTLKANGEIQEGNVEGLENIIAAYCDSQGNYYYADSEGIYRVAAGGTLKEEITPSSGFAFSVQGKVITNLVYFQDSFFCVVKDTSDDSAQLYSYTFDSDATPSEQIELTVWSLSDSPTVRRVLSEYQQQHNDIAIQYTVAGSDDLATEDVLKALNTELLAGSGPDLIVFDGIDVTPYIENGVLADLNESLQEFSILDSIKNAFSVDGKTYIAAARYAIPSIWGTVDDMDQITDLSSFIEFVKSCPSRDDYNLSDNAYYTALPEEDKYAASFMTPQEILQFLMSTSASELITDNTLNQEQLQQLFQAIESIGTYYNMASYRTEQEDDSIVYSDGGDSITISGASREVINKRARIGRNLIDSPAFLGWITKNWEGQAPELKSAPGLCERAYSPKVLLGINASSPNQEAAKDLLKAFFASDIQNTVVGDGLPVIESSLDARIDAAVETYGTDREMLADFLNTENGIVVNLHVQAIDQSDAIKTVKRKITDLDAMKIQEQKRAVRSGYDMDILPSDLATYGQDAKELLKTLQSRNERMFQLTFLVLNTADTRQKLENDVFWAAGIAQKYNCSLVRLDYQQEQGLMSSLPLGASHIQIERSLTTSSVAVFVPFVTQELFQGGDAMYYGINAKTGNMIMLDRKRARCPNGLKLGTPGSGKSMSCKSEIVSVFLCTPDDVYICDPEAEYYPLVKRLHGQVVKLSPTSKNYVNPLDINLNYSEDENPLALKSDFVLSFCELVMGGKNGLEAIEKTVIDRAVQVIYRPYLADPKPENMPILADLHKALLDQHIPEADRVAQALDLYVSGSLNVFNHRTNIDIKNRIVAFDIKELGKQLKKIGMLIVQDQIWGRVTQNRSKGKATWYFCDEFHLLLREEQTAAFSCEIWKRFRKWGGIPTGATQNVKDLLSSPEIENILENSDFICLLNQASGDRKILAERLNISPQQLRYVDNSEPGEGLLIYENVILPFKNPIPKNTQLYQIMTTRLGEGATV